MKPSAGVLVAALAIWLGATTSAIADGVPINAFKRPGDLHIDYPTYSAPSNGDNDQPPEGLMRPVGDVNGDGVTDIAMAISSANSSWTTAAWVTFTPTVLPSTVKADEAPWTGLKIVTGGYSISGIAGVGDVNGDGFGDVALEKAGSTSTGPDAWVVFGGPLTRTVDVSNLGDQGFTITGIYGCYVGGGGNLWTGVFSRISTVIGVGDQNGDGRPDLALCDISGVRVIYTPAQPAGAVVDASQLGMGGASLTAPSDTDGFVDLDTLGDTNGDGRTDLLIGWSQQQNDVHVLSTPVPAAGTTVALTDQESAPGTWSLTATGARLERFNSIGDDNGDGRRDLSLSLVNSAAGRRQMVLYGQAPGTHASFDPLTDGIGHPIEDMYSGVTDVGDQDGDGKADLAYDSVIKLSSNGQSISIDQSWPNCVTLHQYNSGALVLCGYEYKIAGTLPDSNGDGKPELIAIHTDPLPVQDGTTRATWELDVFPSAPPPQPQQLELPVSLPQGLVDFTGDFLTAPGGLTRSLAARATVSVGDGAGHRTSAKGDLVDAGAAASTRATVKANAAQLGLVAGKKYAYQMTLENGRGLTGTTPLKTFTYKPAAGPVARRGKRIVGTRRADRLRGTPFADTILGKAGNDVISGLGGNDRLYGGPGNDRLFAADGKRDIVNCGAGRDKATVDRKDRTIGCEKVRRLRR